VRSDPKVIEAYLGAPLEESDMEAKIQKGA
jgi:Branched-chain amino acid ATP-binding cassette transporter